MTASNLIHLDHGDMVMVCFLILQHQSENFFRIKNRFRCKLILSADLFYLLLNCFVII